MLITPRDPFSRRPVPKVPALLLTLLGFGGAPIGGFPSAITLEQAIATVQAAYRAGLNWFDTAVLYGCGKSLRIIGEALHRIGAADALVTSKVGRRPIALSSQAAQFDIYHEPDAFALEYDYSADGVRSAVEFSLKRLQRDRLDLVFVHDPDADSVPHYREVLRDTLPALAELKRQGLVGAIGIGMNQWEMLRLFILEADIDVVLCAGCYNLMEQHGLELFDFAAEHQVAVLNGGVFASGILASTPAALGTYRYALAPERIVKKAQAFFALCTRFAVDPIAAALQFAAAHPAITALPVGATSVAQVAQNIEAMSVRIPDEFWDEVVQSCGVSRSAAIPGR